MSRPPRIRASRPRKRQHQQPKPPQEQQLPTIIHRRQPVPKPRPPTPSPCLNPLNALHHPRPNQLPPQQHPHQQNPHHPDRQIHRKTPPPTNLGQIPPRHRPNTKTNPRNQRKHSPILGILLQADPVRQDGAHTDIDPRGADALQGAAEQEQREGRGRCRGAQGRADGDDDDRGLQGRVAAEGVGELGEEGEGGC